MTTKPLVIGLGQRFRTDDSVGPLVLDGLIKLFGEKIDAVETQADAARLMELWKGKEIVYLIDSISSTPEKMGNIYRINALEEEVPVSTHTSSGHMLGLADALQLSKILNRLPEKFIIYGITGSDYSHGEKTTSHIKRVVSKAIQQMANEINSEVNHA